jgi:hypothetical protein
VAEIYPAKKIISLRIQAGGVALSIIYIYFERGPEKVEWVRTFEPP